MQFFSSFTSAEISAELLASAKIYCFCRNRRKSLNLYIFSSVEIPDFAEFYATFSNFSLLSKFLQKIFLVNLKKRKKKESSAEKFRCFVNILFVVSRPLVAILHDCLSTRKNSQESLRVIVRQYKSWVFCFTFKFHFRCSTRFKRTVSQRLFR